MPAKTTNSIKLKKKKKTVGGECLVGTDLEPILNCRLVGSDENNHE